MKDRPLRVGLTLDERAALNRLVAVKRAVVRTPMRPPTLEDFDGAGFTADEVRQHIDSWDPTIEAALHRSIGLELSAIDKLLEHMHRWDGA